VVGWHGSWGAELGCGAGWWRGSSPASFGAAVQRCDGGGCHRHRGVAVDAGGRCGAPLGRGHAAGPQARPLAQRIEDTGALALVAAAARPIGGGGVAVAGRQLEVLVLERVRLSDAARRAAAPLMPDRVPFL
jgi:hypothetical protein